MDPDRPGHGGAAAGGLGAGGLHVAVPAPLRAGRGGAAGGHRGPGALPHPRVPARAHRRPGAGAVLLPRAHGRLLLPRKGEASRRGEGARRPARGETACRAAALPRSLPSRWLRLVSLAAFFYKADLKEPVLT